MKDHRKNFMFAGLFLLYCNIRFLKGNYQSRDFPVAVKVNYNKICTAPGRAIKVSCMVTSSRNSSLEFWHTFWQHGGTTLQSFLVSRNDSVIVRVLTIHVDWLGERMFYCTAMGPLDTKSKTYQNTSQAVMLSSLDPSPAPNVLGVRFVQKEIFHKLQVVWTKTKVKNVRYILQYCTEASFDFDEEQPASCPTYESREAKCFENDQDVYGIPHSTGSVCMAAFQAMYFTTYTFRIISEQQGCEHKSSSRSVNASPFNEALALGEETVSESSDNFVAVLIPSSVGFHSIAVNQPRTVNVSWDSHETRWFKLEYNCSASRRRQTIETKLTSMVLSSHDFVPYLPYDVCEFCISGRVFMGGEYSQPSCNVTRLPEESPSTGPMIRCFEEGCPFLDKGNYKDVKMSWTLPAQEKWNGVLTHLVLQASYNTTDYFNTVIHNITQDYIVMALRTGWICILSMVACTRAGCGGIGNTLTVAPKTSSDESERKSVIPLFWLLGFVFLSIGNLILVCRIYNQVCKPAVLSTSGETTEPEIPNVELTGYRETRV